MRTGAWGSGSAVGVGPKSPRASAAGQWATRRPAAETGEQTMQTVVKGVTSEGCGWGDGYGGAHKELQQINKHHFAASKSQLEYNYTRFGEFGL